MPVSPMGSAPAFAARVSTRRSSTALTMPAPLYSGESGSRAYTNPAFWLPPPLSNFSVERLRRDLLGPWLPDLRHSYEPPGSLHSDDLARFALTARSSAAAVPGTFRQIETRPRHYHGTRRNHGNPPIAAGISRPCSAHRRRFRIRRCHHRRRA